MLNSVKLRKNTFELYKKAIIEISESAKILTSSNLNLSLMGFSRQLFEVARTLEILAVQPKLTCAYYLEVRKIELSKIKKSKLHQAGKEEYLSTLLYPEIRKLEECMASENVKLNDWETSKSSWNDANKDTSFYNKISEATHLDINYLIVHYTQTKENVEKYELDYVGDEQQRIQLSKKLFDYWLNRCDDAIQSIASH